MPDQEAWYIRSELGKARPFNAAKRVQVKVRSADGESRWVAISSDQFELIVETLAPTTHTPTPQPTVNNCEGHEGDDHSLLVAGIGETAFCDGSCVPKTTTKESE